MERVIALTESNEDRIKRNNKDMFYDYRKKRIILHKRDVSSTKNNRNQRITWDLKLSPIQYDTQDDISKKIRVAKHFNRINGGIENYPEIGEKVSSLLVESIKGKLSILNTISGI